MCGRKRKRFNLTAVIYDKRGRVLSIGKNNYTKTHPLQAHYAARASKKLDSSSVENQGFIHKIFIHAELDAVLKCSNLDDAYKIVVFRYDSSGKPVNATPCPICRDMLEDLTPIKIIEHT